MSDEDGQLSDDLKDTVMHLDLALIKVRKEIENGYTPQTAIVEWLIVSALGQLGVGQ